MVESGGRESKDVGEKDRFQIYLLVFDCTLVSYALNKMLGDSLICQSRVSTLLQRILIWT